MQLKVSLKSFPKKVVNEVLERIRVDGAQPVTLESIHDLISQMLGAADGPIADLSRGMQAIFHRLDNDVSVPNQPEQQSGTQQQQLQGTFHLWPGVDDSYHQVPFGFTWPKGKIVFVMWGLLFLFFFGDLNRNIVVHFNLFLRGMI